MNSSLPVMEVIDSLRRELQLHPAVILTAPPGAGKSTGVPLSLLREPWLQHQHIWLLEPRRLAAQAVAHRLAHSLGEPLGQTVGLKMRLHSVHSKATRLHVITEGVATKLLREDPALTDVGLIIFDEFHERSVPVDLAFALSVDARRLFKPALKLLVMSATLDDRLLEPLLGPVPIIASEGKQFPVRVQHLKQEPRSLLAALTQAVQQALTAEPGDILVFCPGVGEIQALQQELTAARLSDCVILPLYGDLPIDKQAAVLQPAPMGMRKIILATNVAETSVTIDGVRIVIDSGLARRSRFDPNCGFSRLALEAVACSSLEQRTGRAGRTATGVCYRLFTSTQERTRPAFTDPHILDTDCASLLLEVLDWGTPLHELPWIDPPPTGASLQALELLTLLNACEGAKLTPLGKQLLRLGAHPRLAAMMLRAPGSLKRLACRLAALLGERDIYARSDPPDCDIETRLKLLNADAKRARLVLQVAAQYEQRLHSLLRESKPEATAPNSDDDTTSFAESQSLDSSHAGTLLLWAYPDRIAKCLSAGRYQLRSGQLVTFTHPDRLSQKPYLVVAECRGSLQDSRMLLAAEVNRSDIEQQFGEQITTTTGTRLDAQSLSVVQYSQTSLGKLILSERVERNITDEHALPVLFDYVRKQSLTPWLDHAASAHWLERVCFLQKALPHELKEWPVFDAATLRATLEDWAGPFASGVRRVADLLQMDWLAALQWRLGADGARQLAQWAPAAISVPTGNRITIDYAQDPPRMAVRLQEVFGLTQTPMVANNRIALAVELLSPARRPVQVTRDLASFWHSGYFAVRKELKGRYPKHHWPDDPLQATPTARAKPRTR